MEFDSNRNAFFKLQYCLAIVTNNNLPLINDKVKDRLEAIVKKIFENNWSCKVLKIETKKNSVCIHFEANPQTQLSKLINNFKTVSSRLIRKEFKEHIDSYSCGKSFWMSGYYIISIGFDHPDICKKILKEKQL